MARLMEADVSVLVSLRRGTEAARVRQELQSLLPSKRYSPDTPLETTAPRTGHILSGMPNPSFIVCVALTAALVPALLSQSNIKRPPITGVAHVALRTNGLNAARRFYGHDLGFSSTLARPENRGPAAWFKINDHQYLEIYEL